MTRKKYSSKSIPFCKNRIIYTYYNERLQKGSLMLFRKRRKLEPLLDPVIDRILDDMHMLGPTAEEYPQLLEELEKATKLHNSLSRSWKVSPDTVALVLGNLFGILIIVAYEQKNVITSKGLGFVMKTNSTPKLSS